MHPHFWSACSGVILCPLRSHASIFFVVLGCVFILSNLSVFVRYCVNHPLQIRLNLFCLITPLVG